MTTARVLFATYFFATYFYLSRQIQLCTFALIFIGNYVLYMTYIAYLHFAFNCWYANNVLYKYNQSQLTSKVMISPCGKFMSTESEDKAVSVTVDQQYTDRDQSSSLLKLFCNCQCLAVMYFHNDLHDHCSVFSLVDCFFTWWRMYCISEVK